MRLTWFPVFFAAACAPPVTKMNGAGRVPEASPERAPPPVRSVTAVLADAPTSLASPVATTDPSHFPPADVAPPYAKSAAPGDGHFTTFGDAAKGERTAVEPPIVMRTVLHPHPESRWVTVTVAAIDLRRIALELVPGTEDLRWANLPVSAESGLVKASDRAALAFVTNGGFQPKHGHWGLVANGVVVSRPREDGCTIAVDAKLGVRIAPWTELPEAAREAATLRQTPPCLVDEGAVHPSLLAGKDKPWAGHTTDLRTRRRSAMGIDRTGEILFYAVGEEAEPRWLAEGLRLAGAAYAAELDINWYWTRFVLFGEKGEGEVGLRVTSTLISKMEHLETSYVERASTRDFFYGVLRATAGPTP